MLSILEDIVVRRFTPVNPPSKILSLAADYSWRNTLCALT